MKLDVGDLYDIYTSYKDKVFTKEEIRNQIETVYDSPEWAIYCPLTHAASRYLVWNILGGADWCTAADSTDSQDMFTKYTRNGDKLYVNLRKSDGAIFQYSPIGDGEFRDKTNYNTTPHNAQMPQDAIDWYFDNDMYLPTKVFPGPGDIEGDIYGLKLMNDVYYDYVLCDSTGVILDNRFPHMKHPFFVYESDGSCVVKEGNSGYYVFNTYKTDYLWLDDKNNNFDLVLNPENDIIVGNNEGDLVICDLENNNIYSYTKPRNVYLMWGGDVYVIETSYEGIFMFNIKTKEKTAINYEEESCLTEQIDNVTFEYYDSEEYRHKIYDVVDKIEAYADGGDDYENEEMMESVKKNFMGLVERMNKVITNTNMLID